MRVLLLAPDYATAADGAGPATEALAEGLAARGVTVDVVTGGDHASSNPRLCWNGDAASEGVLTVRRVRLRASESGDSPLRATLAYLAAAAPVVRRLMSQERYDVIHAISLPGAAMLPLLPLRGTAVVVSLRGADVPGYGRGAGAAAWFPAPLARWLWRRADRVVVPSESLGRLARRSDQRLRYAVVPPGVDVGYFRPRVALRRAPDSVVRCLAVGRLVERNGLADLVDALALLERRRYQLEIVGAGPADAALRERVLRLGLEGQVRFTGWLDRPQLARRYREADLFTLAPWAESLGGSFLEALASGLPIVGSTAGGIPELIVHGRHGMLVPPHHPRELAQAIDVLAADPRLRAAIARRNRAEAQEKYSSSRTTTRYLALYNGARRPLRAGRSVAELPASSW